MVDWVHLLKQGSIEHVVERDNVLVKCPWCGAEDPSQHLSISTQGKGWRCLRSPRHKGRSNIRLAAALFHCDNVRARQLVGAEELSLPPIDKFKSTWKRQLGLKPDTERPQHLEMPPEFRPMLPIRSPFHIKFWSYLHDRGFSDAQTEWAVLQYRLHYTITGDYAYRLIIPMYDREGRLASWTGRAVGNREPRYMTLQEEQSVHGPSELLLGMNWLCNVAPARCLVICEGPLDAIKVSALGYTEGIYGTCLFGKQLSAAQASQYLFVEDKFEKVRLLLDADAQLSALEIASNLPRCRVAHLPEGVKDPGELSGAWGAAFLRTLLEEKQ